jgi:ubiquinone/menaquinone biosynthesis C-methylase UbiE
MLMVDQSIHFNDGEVYQRTMGVWSQLAGEQFLDWLALPPGLRWIDIGCGNGAFTELLVQRCAPIETIGVDPSEAQLAFARDRAAAQGANFLHGDALALPFPNDRFDAAVMALVIFFLTDPAKGVAEMARVVRPGGTVAAYAWDMLEGGFPWEPIHAEMREMGITPLLPPTVNASRLDELRNLWTTAGIEAAELRTITVQRTFVSFEEFWATTALAASLKPTLAAMTSDATERLKSRVRLRLSTDAAGQVVYPARANAIAGRVPL